MYIYGINKDNFLNRYLEKETDLKGYVEDYKTECVSFDKAWISETKLSICNLDGSLKYKVENKKLIEIPFDDTIMLQERSEATRKNLIISEIRTVYSIDDEIAMIYKDDNDPDKLEYREYVRVVKLKHKKEK